VALELVVGPEVPLHVRGDPLRLRQVLANLVSNAVKFTAAGRILVTVGAPESRGQGRRLVLSVEDTGIGHSRGRHGAHLRRLRAERRVGRAALRRDGLGLTISRLLVRLMDGELALRSRRGKEPARRWTCRSGR
jgi:signal transduction histidine kinase